MLFNKKQSVYVVLALALLALIPTIMPGYKTSIATEILIFAMLAMSVDVMAGFTGRTSLCHGAIFGVATYVVLHYVTVVGGSVWVGALLGILAAVVLSMIFAALAIRTSGVYFILLTLALGMIVWGVCLRWTSITGAKTASVAAWRLNGC